MQQMFSKCSLSDGYMQEQTNWSSDLRSWVTCSTSVQGFTWSPVRDLSRWFLHQVRGLMGLPSWLSGKESAYQCRSPRRWGFDSGWGRSPGGGNGNPKYSCLGNLMDRGAWRAIVPEVPKSRTQLSDWACRHVVPKLCAEGHRAWQQVHRVLLIF